MPTELLSGPQVPHAEVWDGGDWASLAESLFLFQSLGKLCGREEAWGGGGLGPSPQTLARMKPKKAREQRIDREGACLFPLTFILSDGLTATHRMSAKYTYLTAK